MSDRLCAIIHHDAPFLSLGPDRRSNMTWAELRNVVEKGLPLEWVMHGEARLLPTNLIQDTWRLVQDYMTLVRIGRATGIHAAPYGFTRQQTVPMEDATSTTPVLPPSEQTPEGPTSQLPSTSPVQP